MKKQILVLLFAIFLLTGCNQYVELNHLDVVENLGIDYQNNQFYITATTIEKSEEEYQYNTFTSSGKTIQEAVENMKTQETKKLYIAHLDLLILTPQAIENQLDEIIQFFLQNSESRNDFSLALTDTLDFLEKNDKKQIKEMIQMIEQDTGTTRTIEFEEFLQDTLEQNFSYLPTIDSEKDLKLNSITLIQNKKIVGHLTEEECILYNLLTNRIQNATIEKNRILSNQTRTHFQKEKMKITINAIISVENQKFEKQLEKKIFDMYEKYKEKGIDIFSFQRQVEIANNRFYLKYKDNLFEHISLEFNIKIKANIKERELSSNEK